MPNGLVVCPCLTYKSSSTTLKRLLLLVLTNKTITNPHYWETNLRAHHIKRHPCTNTSFNFSVVRNPYDRLVSYYNDKYTHNAFLPPHMPRGLTLKKFVQRLVSTPLPAKWAVAPAHYAPVTAQWSCALKSQVFKLEEARMWEKTLFKRLGVTQQHLQQLGKVFSTQTTPKYAANLTTAMIRQIEQYARSDFDLFNYSRLSAK